MSNEEVMKIEKGKLSKFTEFHHHTDLGIVEVKNRKNGIRLGGIAYYPKWRQQVFYVGDFIFSADCLEDIARFLRERGK